MVERRTTTAAWRLLNFWPVVTAIFIMIGFYFTTRADLYANKQWHDICEGRINAHETRLSILEGKIDQVIMLQKEILRRMK